MNDCRSEALRILKLYQSGELGGERMPEDSNPGLEIGSAENILYFTLPMALNYQRSAYKLWEGAKECYEDPETADVFVPSRVLTMGEGVLRGKLVKHKVALQPNRHPEIWRRLCTTFVEDFDGDPRRLFVQCENSVERVREYFSRNKKRLPYLGGEKILNYWLSVMERYGGVRFVDRERITVAPDTHVLQASVRIGLMTQEEADSAEARGIAARRWRELAENTGYAPIDFHTPMWLWSRRGFDK